MRMALVAAVLWVSPAFAQVPQGAFVIDIVREYAWQHQRQFCHQKGLFVTDEMIAFEWTVLERFKAMYPNRAARELSWNDAKRLATDLYQQKQENPEAYAIWCSNLAENSLKRQQAYQDANAAIGDMPSGL